MTRPYLKPPATLFLGCIAFLFWASIGHAETCGGGQGEPCTSWEHCAQYTLATECVEGYCEIPCQDKDENRNPSSCSLGETCVLGQSDLGEMHYCKTSSFVMDLNLLDSCIYHFIEGIRPSLTSGNECSLQRNLSVMLDRDSNQTFNIFDVEKCISDFLFAKPCDEQSGTCHNGQTFCTQDDDCGKGLFCNEALHYCQRECGLIVDRSSENELSSLERQCIGDLKVCQYDRGKCKTAELGSTCQTDADCPGGAYCFLGACEATCSSAIDCPSSDWYCSKTNTCLPKPLPASEDVAPFNPKDYSVRLGERKVGLTAEENELSIPVLLMNLVTRKQEFNNPAAVFGYRLETKYAKKLESKCNQNFDELYADELADCNTQTCREKYSLLKNEIIEDCIISPDEEFITLENPFGTVYGIGTPTLDIRLNQGAVERLSPGHYQASLMAIFNNGSMDTTTVTFVKKSPSGQYIGRLSTYIDGPENFIGNTNIVADIRVDMNAAQIKWDDFLQENNIERMYEDITRGYPVTGYIHGDESMMFNWPSATRNDQNKIPVKGIYSPHLGRMRLIAAIEIDANQCWGENGSCLLQKSGSLTVQNPFGRRIRRLIEFIGPFDHMSGLFHGMYRETISGLVPYNVTVEGGFRIYQLLQDDTPIKIKAPIIPDDRAGAFGFTPLMTIEERLEQEIAIYCNSDSASKFKNEQIYRDYLNNMDVDGPIYDQLISFEGYVGEALKELGNDSNSYLTLNEFLQGQIEFCKPSVDADCVDRDKARCGLALYRKALLKDGGWVDRALSGSASFTLFCPDAPMPESDCARPAASNKGLKTLQEHNRFYKELVQTASYEAGNDLSDAFYVMYKAANGDDLEKDSAFEHKTIKLQRALASYDEMRGQMYSPEATSVMFDWPMKSFATTGGSWLAYMHTAENDRLSTLEDLVDLRRRILQSTNSRSYVFMQHLLHDVYLTQVFLAVLQKKWQGAEFDYAGQGPKILDKGALLIARVNENRNPLGLHENQVYFENSDLQNNNWQNYRRRIEERLPVADSLVQRAIENMKASLRDRDNLENSLMSASHEIQRQLEEYCGPDEPLPDVCTLSIQEKGAMRRCEGEDCLFGWSCDSGGQDQCDAVISRYQSGLEHAKNVACREDTTALYIDTSFDSDINTAGGERTCVRGQMGALLQERNTLRLQYRQNGEKLNGLIRQLAKYQAHLKETRFENDELRKTIKDNTKFLIDTNAVLYAAELALNTAMRNMDAADCIVIVGVAAGTTCPGAIAKAAGSVAAGAVFNGAKILWDRHVQNTNLASDLARLDNQAFAQEGGLEEQLWDIASGVDNIIHESELLLQQLFNVEVRVLDTHYKAQQAAARHNEVVGSIVSRLVGRESGSVLLRNKLIQQSNEEFQKLLYETYKMSQAFRHRYNLGAQGEAMVNQVYSLMTVDDIRDYVEDLTKLEADYCGANGLDCDYKNNQKIYRVSLRDLIAPDLKDIPDPKTGAVLTKGQQFHNLITSSRFVRRSKRSTGMRDQIEIPFAIWMNDYGDHYMVNPEECNHFIVGQRNGNLSAAGTIAANVFGSRFDGDIEYELWRGHTDYVRSCDEKLSEMEHKVNIYNVGWAPQSSFGQMDEPPTYQTHSTTFTACQNNWRLEDPNARNNEDSCFNFFARDRSLGSPDWKFIIPLVDEEQSWIFGEGLKEKERPLIEDIVLYFRYNSRPINYD